MSQRRFALSFIILLGLGATIQAAPSITVGPHPGLPTSGNTTLDIFYSPPDITTPIQGQTLDISIADEGNGIGTDPADPGEPKIVNIDAVTGTNWSANNTGQQNNNVFDQVWVIDMTTEFGSVLATGKVFSITINPNGALPGSTWNLRLFSVLPHLGPVDSNWSGNPGTEGTPFLGSNGSFQYVPEPSTLALCVLGAIGAYFLARKRQLN